jgi:hypothetical protein
MNLNEFITKMKEIKNRGCIKSYRMGDTGIGKTLEDLLGIEENNISGPDFSNYELKSGRKDSTSMLTLFTKTPQPRGAVNDLVEKFGYSCRSRKRDYHQKPLDNHIEEGLDASSENKELHVTLDSKKENSVGLMVKITENRLLICYKENEEAYYNKETLKSAFESKYHKMIYVLADNEKDEEGNECFRYDEVYLLDGFNFERFSSLIEDGLIKIDLRIGHYQNGRVHDHGTAFRIKPVNLPKCFENIQKII